MRVSIKYLIIIFFLLLTIFLLDSYQKYEKILAFKTLIKNEKILNNFLVQVGRERDLTALYMGSNYKNFNDLLTQQRVVLDKEILRIKKDIKLTSSVYIPFLVKDKESLNITLYQNIASNFEKILIFRTKVEHQNSTIKEIFFDGYISSLIKPLSNTLLQSSYFTSDAEMLYCVSLLYQLNIAKENTGVQRGFVAYFMEKSLRMNSEDMAKWEEIKGKSNSFQPPQMRNMDIEKKIKKLYNIPATKDMLLNIDDISLSIMVDSVKGKYKEDTNNWFTFQTQKISLFSKIQIILISQLEKRSKTVLLYKQIIFILSFLLWISTLIWLILYIQKTKKDLKIPLIENDKNMKFDLVIALLTKIAHSNGAISHPEKDVINYTMNNFVSIGEKQGMSSSQLISLKEQLNQAYRKAKIDNISVGEYAHYLENCAFDIKVQVLKQLVSMAAIDGYSMRKKLMIYEAVEAIGFDKLKIQKYINDIIGEENRKNVDNEMKEISPYDVLGCHSSDDNHTIKKKYIEQVKEFHPDYIQGKGLNIEIIKFAEQKIKDLNHAHDLIKKERKK